MKKFLIKKKYLNSLPEIKKKAKKKLFYKTWNWAECGAEHGNTLKANLDSFKNLKLIPRVMRYNSKSYAYNKFLGTTLKSPIIIAPMGHLTQFHKNGEAEVALGAEKSSTVATISSLSRINLNEIRKYSKKSTLIYQIYFFNDRKWIEGEIKKALKIKCSAIVVTVDATTQSIKYITKDDKYDARKFGRRSNFNLNKRNVFNVNWKEISWIKKKIKNIPLIIKGIMHPEDAKLAFKYGANGIWVSNHGGRVFESNVGTIEVLEKIRKKIGKTKLIILDGGIRTGSDVVKACSLGANLVAIGRPVIYGLVANGSDGIANTFKLFEEEYNNSKILSGY